jgi:DNA-binding CsgD family transcriptional regulator
MSRDAATTLNSLIDATDLLDEALSSDQAWLMAVNLMQKDGFNALNIAEFDSHSGEVLWFRSSMKAQWLADYIDQDFMSIDPLVLGSRDGHNELRLIDGRAEGFSIDTEQKRGLSDQVVSWGYGALDTQVFNTVGKESVKVLTVSRGDPGREPEAHHRLLCAVASTAVSAPRSFDSPGAIILPSNLLSIRETDVLSFLASGLRNDAIAWKMNIAEVTVRMHLASARRKLGAATREEAVALAIRSGQLPL